MYGKAEGRSGGIRVILKGGAADAVNAAYADAQRAGQSDDNRLKALYAARKRYTATHPRRG